MRRRLRHFFLIFAPVFITVLLLFVLLCYVNQWDHFAVITVIPIWIWALLGTLSSLFFALVLKSKTCIALFFVWLMTGICLSDESRSLGREFWRSIAGTEATPEVNESIYRVVSINCSLGSIEAVEEARSLQPDIIFLQEAPADAAIESLFQEMFEGQASIIRHHGNVIAARGNLEAAKFPQKENSTFRTTLRMMDGTVFDLGNIHLERAIPRFDIWRSKAWEEYTASRIENRKVLRHLMRFRTEKNPQVRATLPPLIVGGDFSTPPGDDIFRMLKKAGLEDASFLASQGSGNTYPSHFPALRIDQFWLSDQLVPVKIDSIKTEHSDHKILVCDFVVREK